MKITEQYLRRIIKKETGAVLYEVLADLPRAAFDNCGRPKGPPSWGSNTRPPAGVTIEQARLEPDPQKRAANLFAYNKDLVWLDGTARNCKEVACWSSRGFFEWYAAGKCPKCEECAPLV